MGGVSSGALPRPQGPPFPQAVLQLRCSQPPNCAARSPLPVVAEVPVPCSLPCTLANLCPREESGPDSGANLAPGSPWASQACCSPTRARDGCSGSFCVSHDGHMGNTAASKHPGFLTNTWGWTARAGFPALRVTRPFLPRASARRASSPLVACTRSSGGCSVLSSAACATHSVTTGAVTGPPPLQPGLLVPQHSSSPPTSTRKRGELPAARNRRREAHAAESPTVPARAAETRTDGHPHTKIASTWFRDLHLRPDTISLLEKNTGRTFFDINCSNIFLQLSPPQWK